MITSSLLCNDNNNNNDDDKEMAGRGRKRQFIAIKVRITSSFLNLPGLPPSTSQWC